MEKIQRLADEKKRKAATPSTPDTPTSVGGDSPRRSPVCLLISMDLLTLPRLIALSLSLMCVCVCVCVCV